MNDAIRTYQPETTRQAHQQRRTQVSVASSHNGRADHVGQYFTLVLFGAFVVLLLLGLWMGTVAFRTITVMQNATDDARLALASLQNRVRSFDQADSFGTAQGPEGPAIVFTYKLEAGDYETRLYLYQGALVQELAFSTDPYLPMTATKIVETSTFSFTCENGLLSVTCDQGTVDVALRSEVLTSVNAGEGVAGAGEAGNGSNAGAVAAGRAEPEAASGANAADSTALKAAEPVNANDNATRAGDSAAKGGA